MQRLLDILPSSTTDDILYGPFSNAVLFGKARHGHVIGNIPSPNIAHLLFSQFGPKSFLALWMTLLHNCVVHIVSMRSCIQMLRADARGVVSIGAVMTGQKSIRKRSVGKFIRKAVGAIGDMVMREDAISALIDVTDPQPASFGFLDMSPEPFHQRPLITRRPGPPVPSTGLRTKASPSFSTLTPFCKEGVAAVFAYTRNKRNDSGIRSTQPRTVFRLASGNPVWKSRERGTALLAKNCGTLGTHQEASLSGVIPPAPARVRGCSCVPQSIPHPQAFYTIGVL